MIFKKLLLISIGLFLLSALMQMMSWQYWGLTRLVGLIGIGASYIGITLSKEDKQPIHFLKMSLVILWVIINILVLLQMVEMYPLKNIGQGLLAIFVFLEVINPTNNQETPLLDFLQKPINKILAIGAGVTIGVGSLYKVLSWENANTILMVGFSLISVLILFNIFNRSE